AALAALPLCSWGRAGLLPLLSGAFALLGVAMFGMRTPGRLSIMLEWTFLLGYLVALSACCSFALRLAGAKPAAEEAAPVSSVPRWFALARAAVLLFVAVSVARLGYLTITTPAPGVVMRFLDHKAGCEVVRGLDRAHPGLLSPADLRPDRILV